MCADVTHPEVTVQMEQRAADQKYGARDVVRTYAVFKI
jgi:hypothetical protein